MEKQNPWDSPLRPDAFDVDDKTKIALIEQHFREILTVLGLDLEDDSLKNTPRRVAKMYVREIFSGLNPCNKPKVSLFENQFDYNKMIIERDITVHSNCEHHFVPFMGKAHVGYFSSGKVIGLSKINRVVHYFCNRPQLQERLTLQIIHELKDMIGTEDIAVLIKAKHMCVASRGIQDDSTNTITAEYFGKFNDPDVKSEFLKLVGEV
jgi:GTP cyclohydrolase IA